MEMRILFGVHWHINPPTSMAFAGKLLDLVPSHLIPDKAAVLDAIESQVRMAILDENFLPIKASSIALAAVMNCLQEILQESYSQLVDFSCLFKRALDYRESFAFEIEELQTYLMDLLRDSSAAEDTPTTEDVVCSSPEKDVTQHPSSMKCIIDHIDR